MKTIRLLVLCACLPAAALGAGLSVAKSPDWQPASEAQAHMLWPPNHQMVPVTLHVVVSDAADPAPTTRIIAVTSNEPTGGWFSPDRKITGPLMVNLRAEHARFGSTRIYTITVESRDHSGNASTRTATVIVPREAPRFPHLPLHGPK